jgi:hypothetical protein
MVARGIRKTPRRHRTGKHARRRPRGVQVKERTGVWHAYGVVHAGGRPIRIRKSLGLPVDRYSFEQAEQAAQELADEARAIAQGTKRRGSPLDVAALDYLEAPRERRLRPSSIRIVKRITAKFGARRLNEIPDEEWFVWIDGEPGKSNGAASGVKSSTRERLLNTVVAFLNHCKRKHGLAGVPAFRRDRRATNPNRRARRRVEDLTPDLIGLLLNQAHPTIRAQLAVEVSTGARVSSVLHGVRLCDLNLAPGREAITFQKTKSGLDVHAVLSPSAAAELRHYLKWRRSVRPRRRSYSADFQPIDPHDREAPLFLTPYHEPYADNGGAGGTQNRKGFNGAKARAAGAIRQLGAAIALRLRHVDRAAAREASAIARTEAALISKVTQHWFRHRLATLWLRKDPRAAMDQGGWLDIRSIMGYSHDAPEFRRQVAAELDPLAPRRGTTHG